MQPDSVENYLQLYASLFFTGQVLSPTNVYNGQKLTRLVNTNITASTSNTIPSVPVIMLVKYKIAITTAISVLIILSVVPMLFFIIFIFKFII